MQSENTIVSENASSHDACVSRPRKDAFRFLYSLGKIFKIDNAFWNNSTRDAEFWFSIRCTCERGKSRNTPSTSEASRMPRGKPAEI